MIGISNVEKKVATGANKKETCVKPITTKIKTNNSTDQNINFEWRNLSNIIDLPNVFSLVL